MSAKAAAAAPPAAPARADYGIDAPKIVRQMFIRGATLIVFGIAIAYMNRNNAPGAGVALFAVLGLIGAAYVATGFVMRWSSTTAKPRVLEQILDSIPWRGDEKVLDVGCGRGAFLIAAAKRLSKPAKATGVDIWNPKDQSGNSAEQTLANARAEAVADRVKVDTGDARKLPSSASNFDVVLSSLALHNLEDELARSTAVREMWRVLKPGGYLAIFDVAHTGDYKSTLAAEGAEMVRESGFSMLWAMPGTRWFVVRRPS